MTRTPNSDCQACGGDGVDADPHGMFDYDCVAPCPQCWTDAERNTARDDGTRRTRAMVAACEGISTEALEAGAVARLVDAANALQDDLLMRAERDDDGTKVVNASHGRWIRFCAALALIKGEKQ